MKKKILLVLTFILSFLIFTDKAFAARLDFKSYTLECIYEDGGLYTEEWSVGQKAFINSRSSYNLAGAQKNESNKGGYNRFSNRIGRTLTYKTSSSSLGFGVIEDETTNCANFLYSASITEEGVSTNFYVFGREFTCNNDDCDDFELEQGGWCAVWGCKGGTSAGQIATKTPYNLVSERYLLGDDYPEPDQILYYVMPAEQKIGTPAYIRVYIYENIVLLEKDGRVTRIEDSEKEALKTATAPSKIYLNSPEPIPVSDSSSVVNYRFNENQTKYSVSLEKDDTHKYEFVITNPNPNGDDNSGSLCTERLKNTSPVLKSIIQLGQILVPALVIILTALDIGKIVISGNVEEELPKRKKTIINRAIILVVFLFLPLLVKVLLKLMKTSGSDIAKNIEYIDCLFDSSATAGTGTGSVSKPGKTNNSKTGITAEEK